MQVTTQEVRQEALAASLRLTPRRVRQLIDAGILPKARDGHWSVAVCYERYRLFRADPASFEWEEFQRELISRAKIIESDIEVFMGPNGRANMVGPLMETFDCF